MAAALLQLCVGRTSSSGWRSCDWIGGWRCRFVMHMYSSVCFAIGWFWARATFSDEDNSLPPKGHATVKVSPLILSVVRCYLFRTRIVIACLHQGLYFQTRRTCTPVWRWQDCVFEMLCGRFLTNQRRQVACLRCCRNVGRLCISVYVQQKRSILSTESFLWVDCFWNSQRVSILNPDKVHFAAKGVYTQNGKFSLVRSLLEQSGGFYTQPW